MKKLIISMTVAMFLVASCKNKITDAAKSGANAVGDTVKAGADTVKAGAEKVGDVAGNAAGAVGDTVKAGADTVKAGAEKVGDVAGAAVDTVKDGAAAVKDTAGAAVGTVKDGAAAVGTAVKDGVAGTIEVSKDILGLSDKDRLTELNAQIMCQTKSVSDAKAKAELRTNLIKAYNFDTASYTKAAAQYGAETSAATGKKVQEYCGK